jgi:NAD(P)-dependent dehydrogenase (short-subunit alcohol dehydrogenase family)
MNRAVIVTGSNGGIGAAIKNVFVAHGYAVIGVGRSPDAQSCDEYVQVDFSALVNSEIAQEQFSKQIKEILKKYKLAGLINNSAVQILGDFEDLTLADFTDTLNVNLVAPFFISKLCFPYLSENTGSIVNIGSIHGKLTKKKFVAYATSKGALETMTRAMAVDCGEKVRINLIAPAAIETEMLRDGFKGSPEKYEQLKRYHPSGTVGSVNEVAQLALRLIDDDMPFLNGAVIDMTGGISNRLHDPG